MDQDAVLFARSRTHDLSLVYRLIIILLIKILSVLKSQARLVDAPLRNLPPSLMSIVLNVLSLSIPSAVMSV